MLYSQFVACTNSNHFAEKEFTWDRTGGDPITQGNRNPLLYKSFVCVISSKTMTLIP